MQVFTDASLDQSIILEFLERASAVSDDGAGEYYFEDLATNAGASQAAVVSVKALNIHELQEMPSDAVAQIVTGHFAASKGRQGQDALNKVHVMMLIVRLPHVATDVLLTMNTPMYIHAASAAAAQAGSGYKDTYLTAPALFGQIVRSLKIVDWKLFGN